MPQPYAIVDRRAPAGNGASPESLFLPDGRVHRIPAAQAREGSDRHQRLPGRLLSKIKNSAQDRWRQLAARGMTPERVQQILDGAINGDLEMQYSLFELMEETWYRLAKNLNEVKRAACKIDYGVQAWAEPGQTKSSEAADEKRDFVERAMKGLRSQPILGHNGFSETLYDLMDAHGKGLSVLEILWERGADGSILPGATQWVHPRHYGYPAISHEPDTLQLSPSGRRDDFEAFPQGGFLVGIRKAKTGHPINAALLRPLAALWIGSQFSYDWALNLAQMFGLPIRWANYDPTKEAQLDDICSMLENMGSAGWAAFPTGTTLELKEATKNAQNNPQSWLLNFADTACDLLILGQVQTADGGDGSRAKAETQFMVRADIIEDLGKWGAEIFNQQFVPTLLQLNYGNDEEMPRVVAEIEEVKDAKAMAERDRILLKDIGLPVVADWFYRRHEVPVPSEGDEILELNAEPADPANPGAVPGSSDRGPGSADDASSGQARASAAGRNGEQARAMRAAPAPGQSLRDFVLEELTGVSPRWLAPLARVFDELIEKAENENVSDEDFLAAVRSAQESLPELFPDVLQQSAQLQELLTNAMSASVVNGAQLAGRPPKATAKPKTEERA